MTHLSATRGQGVVANSGSHLSASSTGPITVTPVWPITVSAIWQKEKEYIKLKHSLYRLKLTYTTLPAREPMKFAETESNVELKRLKIVSIIHTKKERAKRVCGRRVLKFLHIVYIVYSFYTEIIQDFA